MYTITIRNQARERIKWMVFHYRHQATTWMLLNGFFDGVNNMSGESAELKRRGIVC